MPHFAWPWWVKTLAALPAAAFLWILLAWNPASRRHWFLAAGMAVYVFLYYIVFIR